MHKDIACGLMLIDRETGSVRDFRQTEKEHAPFLGNASVEKIKRWWEARAVPASRKAMEQIIRASGSFSPKDYLVKNLGLSMTDCYWLCPLDLELEWSRINLFENAGNVYDAQLPFHHASSFDPNASLGGQMDKYWDLRQSPPALVKIAYHDHGQQAVNEAFASYLHKKQNTEIPFVSYSLEKTEDNGTACICNSFTNIKTELIPAIEITDSAKCENDTSIYDHYIQICTAHGIDEGMIRDYMDYQTLTDFIISNTDEHLMNFGVLRDSETLRLIGPAPLFDSGNSMFYADRRRIPYQRHELLQRKITAIHEKEEMMLKHVKNKKIVAADLLPEPEAVMEFYTIHGIPEEKAAFITENYRTKCSMLREFQSGKQISYYLEKKAQITEKSEKV